MFDDAPLDDALDAYAAGHHDGAAGQSDPRSATHPATGADYRVGLADGHVTAFQAELLKQVRRALQEPPENR